MRKLLGRISSSQATSSLFWHLYALAKKPSDDCTDITAWMAYFDMEEKSLRLMMNEKVGVETKTLSSDRALSGGT